VAYCLERDKSLDDLSLEEFRRFSDAIGGDVYEAISIARCVAARNVTGGPAPEAVQKAIRAARERLDKNISC